MSSKPDPPVPVQVRRFTFQEVENFLCEARRRYRKAASGGGILSTEAPDLDIRAVVVPQAAAGGAVRLVWHNCAKRSRCTGGSGRGQLTATT